MTEAMNQLQLRQAKSSIIWLPDAEDAVAFDLPANSKMADAFFMCKKENGRLIPSGVCVVLAKSRTVDPSMSVLQVM